jgi:hypothetical protein
MPLHRSLVRLDFVLVVCVAGVQPSRSHRGVSNAAVQDRGLNQLITTVCSGILASTAGRVPKVSLSITLTRRSRPAFFANIRCRPSAPRSYRWDLEAFNIQRSSG